MQSENEELEIGSVVKRLHCSRRGSEFCSEHLFQGPHCCLWTPAPKDQTPLASASSCTHVYIPTCRQIDTQLKIDLTKVKTNQLVNIALFTVHQEAIFTNMLNRRHTKSI